MFHVKHS
jgi:hypothetical protein